MKMTIKEQTTAGGALEQFKVGMTQLATAMKAAGGSTPTQAAKAPTSAQPGKETGGTAPSTAPAVPGAKQPASSAGAATSGPSKEVAMEDLAKKVQELGIAPDKAATLLQYYGIKIVK